MCILLECIFKPYVKNLETFIQDSQNLIQKTHLRKFSKKSILATLDVVNLYTNINHSECEIRLTDFLLSKNFNSEHIDITGFKKILNLVLNNNYFSFNNIFFKQILGVAMGSKCGGSLANIFLYTYEIKWINLHTPSFYCRFIDDIFIITKSISILENLKKSFGSLELTYEVKNHIHYLDLSISQNSFTLRLNFSLYFKKTNTFSYLLNTSNHPDFILKNIPKSLFIRIRRICSSFIDYIYFSENLTNKLLSRGYKLPLLNKIFNMVANLDRIKLLEYKTKSNNNFKNSIPFKLEFDKNVINFNEILSRSFEDSIKKIETFKQEKIFLINKTQPSLGSLLIHNFKFPHSVKNFYRKCSNIKCKICIFSNHNAYFIKINDKFSLPLLSYSNCDSKNCVYLIYCNFCNAFYIGQTEDLKKRFSAHKSKIINFKPFSNSFDSISTHFNLKFHNYLLNFSFFVIQTDIEDKSERLNIEMFFIHLLLKLEAKLINDFIPAISIS